MKSKETQKHIDRIVGTEGTLRIPSWWMHKILSDLVKYCEDNEDASVTIKEYVESQLNLVGKTIEDLDTRLENIESRELFEIVDQLPSEPKGNTIYLIPYLNGKDHNVLTEWVYINDTWEQFGELKVDIDLSNYATKEEVNTANEKQDEDIAALGEARKNLSSQIADNKSRIDATATNVIKLTEELDILKGEGDGSIEDIVSKEIAKVIASAPEDLDTLREIADFIEAEATEATQIATKLDDHAERIKKLEDKNLDIVMMTESQYEMLPEKENKLYFLYED